MYSKKQNIFQKEPLSYMQTTVTITRQCGVSELCPVQWQTKL